MLKKSLQHLQKVVTVLCCMRETLEFVKTKNADVIQHTVSKDDVEIGWMIVERSINTFSIFNV